MGAFQFHCRQSHSTGWCQWLWTKWWPRWQCFFPYKWPTIFTLSSKFTIFITYGRLFHSQSACVRATMIAFCWKKRDIWMCLWQIYFLLIPFQLLQYLRDFIHLVDILLLNKLCSIILKIYCKLINIKNKFKWNASLKISKIKSIKSNVSHAQFPFSCQFKIM